MLDERRTACNTPTKENDITATQSAPGAVLGRTRIQTDSGPAALVGLEGSSFFGRSTVPMVEVLTADEQRGRTSQAYFRSAVGTRLGAPVVEAGSRDDAEVTIVTQRDSSSGLEIRSVLTRPHGTSTLRLEHVVTNTSTTPVVLTAVSSANIGLGHSEHDLDTGLLLTGRSEWLAENRWNQMPLRTALPHLSLPIHGQDGRGHFTITSQGAWSSGEHIPTGVIVDQRSGEALGWQIETSAGWIVDLCQTLDGGVLSLLGPTDLQHQFAHRLLPGESFETVPVVLAVSEHGVDGVAAQLTAHRRWLRSERSAEEGLPIIYNDFMNTLMGQPTTQSVLPLVREAALAGAEVYCMDAGWFADPAIGDWWSTVGEWQVAENRFSGGLSEIMDEIRGLGMRPGLWLEPEVVGVCSPAATSLPEGAFFHRFGRRVREHDRYHLDFRHPAARAHVDEVVDRLVAQFGIGYLKLDYNINPGAGTDDDATAPGDGLLGHTRALKQWLIDVQDRHPGLLLENCSSGAMRMDYSLLAVTHLQSTSDQQDLLLYPPVAAAAPLAILPEQCGNWAYPAAGMTAEETVYTLVTGLSGRFYLSGFLNELRDEQRRLVHEAVAVHRKLRGLLPEGVPFWPLGLPAWDAPMVCLGLRTSAQDLLFLWNRSEEATDVVLPVPGVGVEQVFPADAPGWDLHAMGERLHIRTLPGPTARVLRIPRALPGAR